MGFVDAAPPLCRTPRKLSRVWGEALTQALLSQSWYQNSWRKQIDEFHREYMARLSGAVLDAVDGVDEDVGARRMPGRKNHSVDIIDVLTDFERGDGVCPASGQARALRFSGTTGFADRCWIQVCCRNS